MSELENGFRIGDVVAMVRRRLPIVVGASLLGAVVGYTMFAGTPETFSATASVQVAPIRIDQFSEESRSEVDIATERALVKSDAVAETVRDELGLEGDNRAILRRIVVVNDLDSLVLRISYDGDTADQAKRGADAAAKGYLDQRKDNATSTRDAAVARLNEEIAAAETAAQDASTRLDATLDGTPERAAARTRLTNAESTRDTLIEERTRLNGFDPETVGALVRAASVPEATTSKMALGKGVGVFGLFVLAGLAIAWFFDRRDGLGGGRRRIEAIVPGANLRVMPGAAGANASPAEVDTAIDRLAVELVAGGSPGKPASVLVIGAGIEPPMALAEELASSLTFAGIPALFVLAGTSDREVRHAHVVGSFADLVASGASVAGPAGLTATAGEPALIAGPIVTWLRPKGSAEAAGLLRRAVVDSLVSRAGRERFEAVVFVSPSPARGAAGTALGQWVGRVAIIVGPDERPQAESVATALAEADVRVTEVVWT